MAVWENVIRPPAVCVPAASHSIICSPPPICFAPGRKRKKAGRWIAGIAARLGREDPDPLLRAALTAASLRFQETLRPDPLFIDSYAGCLVSPDNGNNNTEEQHPVSTTALSPCQYRLATKFFDDKLLSLVSSNEDLRQIVLLTDGMDTRPYRLSWPRLCVIFDISPGRVFKVASERLEGIGAKISKTRMLLHVPLESPGLQTILCKKGYNGNRPSLWALQGLPLMTLTSLKDIMFIISSLAMKGSIFMGELPGCLLRAEFGNTSTIQKGLEKLFMSNAFQVDLVDYDEVSRNLHLDPLPGDNDNVLFIAKQLRLSDSQMESWWAHFHRLDEEGDEEGFEEL